MKQEDDLIARALQKVAHIEEERPAARMLGIAPRTLKAWRAGQRPDMREPMRKKLISKLEGVPVETRRTESFWWESEARAAEARARAAEKEAEAALERAIAARLAEENARDLMAGVFSLDPRDHLDAARAVRAVGLARKHLPPDDAPEAGSPRQGKRPPGSE